MSSDLPSLSTVASTGDGDLSTEPPLPLSDEARQARTASAFWTASRTLYRWKWFIGAVTLIAGAAAVAVSLSLPVWFQSTTRLLPPETDSGGLSSLLGDVSPLAASFLNGGGSGDYNRYLAILESRSTRERVVDRFDLVDVYALEDKAFPREEALKTLDENLDIEVDLELDYLSISVLDQDPERAAQVANFLVEALNERNEALALEGASAYRRYVEERYREIELRSDSIRAEMQAFQERNGVVELPTMAEGLVESLATVRAAITSAEIEYRALLSELGPDNPQVKIAENAYETAQNAERRLVGGQEAVMPVPFQRLPAVGAQYARIYQDALIQKALLENARPLLEQARFDEERERTAVQVLDPAVPAVHKAKPKRSVIVLLAMGSAFMIASLFALAWGWLRRHRTYIAAQLRGE